MGSERGAPKGAARGQKPCGEKEGERKGLAEGRGEAAPLAKARSTRQAARERRAFPSLGLRLAHQEGTSGPRPLTPGPEPIRREAWEGESPQGGGTGTKALRGEGGGKREEKEGREEDTRLPAAAQNRSYFRLGSRSPSARSTQHSGERGRRGTRGTGNGRGKRDGRGAGCGRGSFFVFLRWKKN